ncbi:MAG: hypothetical protein ACXW1U_16700 [Methylobacter sp.]
MSDTARPKRRAGRGINLYFTLLCRRARDGSRQLSPARHIPHSRQELTISEKSLGRFLLRLSSALSFEDYDRLTRAVWVVKLRTAPEYPASPCKLGMNPDNLKR